MTLIRKMAGALSLSAIAALMLASVFATSASAQAANPMDVYGVTGNGDIVDGSVVEAFIDGASVGTGVATAEGWTISIPDGTNGAVVTFTIDGAPAAESIDYTGFALVEVTLTAGAGAGETPAPAETGNAGLLGSTGTSMALVLALGVFAAAMVAGGRTATRRS